MERTSLKTADRSIFPSPPFHSGSGPGRDDTVSSLPSCHPERSRGICGCSSLLRKSSSTQRWGPQSTLSLSKGARTVPGIPRFILFEGVIEYIHYSPKLTASMPIYSAACPSSSSMRSNWLYLAMRSVREAEPVLICPAFVATAKSAMNVSSVSPLR
jgi:hypothetical protein